MALDTLSRQLSAVNAGLPFRAHLPVPDGTLDQGDFQHLAYWCSVPLFGEAADLTAVGLEVTVPNYRLHVTVPSYRLHATVPRS